MRLPAGRSVGQLHPVHGGRYAEGHEGHAEWGIDQASDIALKELWPERARPADYDQSDACCD